MTMHGFLRHPGSYRDPRGHIYVAGSDIFRTVSNDVWPEFQTIRPVLARFVDEGRLVAFEEVDDAPDDRGHTLRHPHLPFISYPYEWPFEALKSAALFHLDLQIDALKHDVTLSDASAYNVQFIGAQPIFIDHLSFRPYTEGEYWTGHRQFCEQFLNPLLLRSCRGVAHNEWYRGSLEGIPTSALNRLLSLRHKSTWNVLTHVVLQDRLQSRTQKDATTADRVRSKKLAKRSYLAILGQMRAWIARLSPADRDTTTWASYAENNTYDDEEKAQKRQFVRNAVARYSVGTVIDLGCNTGDYSRSALDGGAKRAIGFDYDQQALDRAFLNAAKNGTPFTPLFLDAANPVPDQGWRQLERSGFASRAQADFVLALAFEHHLAIARNIPLSEVVDWLVSIAPFGVIEFVHKDDPTIQKMLELREDIFGEYSEDTFRAELLRRAEIVETQTVSRSGRTLYLFQRH
ncbi:class I SAM-dependent methyltransferase [Nitratireductor arenosus]|nr:50S ribosomal protein L11 methyltransferase [Nitratireductor arenosus]